MISETLHTKAKAAMARLRRPLIIDGKPLSLYNAGLQQGRVRFGLFTRDLLITALMLQDQRLLKDTLQFALATLGKRCDPRTGEEPGRALHEFDEVEIRDLGTRYNASETSQLLLIAATDYLQISKDIALLREHRAGFQAVIRYILSHIREGLFWEDPSICGARRYALRATYWKDSYLPGRVDPIYPVAYTLVQAQTIAALRAAATMAEALDLGHNPGELEDQSAQMVEALFSALWDERLGYPLIAKDGGGVIAGIASDGLHMLSYLKTDDIPPEKFERIRATAQSLKTPYGFRTYAPGQPDYSATTYHWGAIWPFEQFFIAKGALIPTCDDVLPVALRVIEALERLGFAELFYWDERGGLRGPGAISGEGCDLQLWSAAFPQAIYQLLRGPERQA